jgi:hypothetical protein
MPDIVFYHPAIRPSKDGSRPGPYLVVKGIDEISWGYTLNTSTYPTYGAQYEIMPNKRPFTLTLHTICRSQLRDEARQP